MGDMMEMAEREMERESAEDWRQAVDERERFSRDILEKVKPYLTEAEYKHLCFETGITGGR